MGAHVSDKNNALYTLHCTGVGIQCTCQLLLRQGCETESIRISKDDLSISEDFQKLLRTFRRIPMS